MKKNIFIASFPKSGNTWLRTIITSLLLSNEKFELNKINKIRLFSDISNFKFVKEKKFQKNGNLDFNWMSNNWINIQKIINSQSNKNIIYKTHSVRGKINGTFFTDESVCLGFIYIVRDPRDVVISLSRHSGSPIDKTIFDVLYDNKKITSARGANELISTWRNNINSWLDFTNVSNLIIKYEEILVNPKEHILKIILFLEKIMNIKFNIDDKKLQEILFRTSFENLQATEKLNGFSEATKYTNFFREGKSNQWKSILNREQIRNIEKELSVPLQSIGYI